MKGVVIPMVNVACLSTQESLFETRILRRMAEPVFLAPSDLPNALSSPLLLFGSWHEAGFPSGLSWLGSVAYQLPFPCLVFPPFELGRIDDRLGLAVSLKVEALNTNAVEVRDEGFALIGVNRQLRVQADYGFAGAAGKTLVTAGSDNVPAVVTLQPRSTATPLLLCGLRVFSSSSLSSEEDRLLVFDSLLKWANALQKLHNHPKLGLAASAPLSVETVNTLCVLMAGTGANTVAELRSLADSLLGIDLSVQEVETTLKYLSEQGLIVCAGGETSVLEEPLQRYIDIAGLWSYVRLLRREFVGRSGV